MQTDYWQSFIVGTLGVVVTVIVSGFRPDLKDTVNQPILFEKNSPTVTTRNLPPVFNHPTFILIQGELTDVKPATDKTIDQTSDPEEIQLLNQLLLDFFTTDFNELTQAKWQQHLYMGSPFLSELANYLKLDQIYELELNQTANRRLSENFWLRNKSTETYNANIFNLFFDTTTNLWPLSLFTNNNLEKPIAKILLNHYDRAFLNKIERHGLASELRPLAKGIERLLAYHIKQTVDSQSPLGLTDYQKDIDQVVAEMINELGDQADLFRFYKIATQQEWESAAQLLVQSNHLNQPAFLFLYDLITVQDSSALMNLASFETISQHPAWWTEFLNYELCVGGDQHVKNLLSIYLPIATPCTSNNDDIGRIIKTKSNQSAASFIIHILQKKTLTAKDIETFIAKLSPDNFNDVTRINGHTLINHLAKEGKLKTLRNAQVFRHYEKNYQTWRQYMNFPDQDSFFSFSAIHHWYSDDRERQQQSMNQDMPSVLPNLSPLIQLRLAQSLLERFQSGLLTEQNWHYYKPLLKNLSYNEIKKFQTLSQVVPWLSLSDTKAKPDTANNTQITEQTILTVLMHDLHRTMDQANSLEDFLNRALVIIRSHRLRSLMVTENSMIDNHGELSLSAMRQLKRIWRHNHR